MKQIISIITKKIQSQWPLIALLCIGILGTILRFYRLGDVPAGFHRDEAYLGYNAYSILKTGYDMTGNFLPIHIPSFLYCPAGYSYFSIPSIALFGLSAFSVRFASALYGSLTIILTYFFVLKLDSMNKLQKNSTSLNKSSSIIALLSSFFLAITPWHINLSRTSTENTIVIFFITLGTYLFLLYVYNHRIWQLLTAFASFAITLGIYQAPRAFLPLFIPIIVFAYLHRLSIEQRIHILILFSFTIILPLVLILTSEELATRIRTVSLFATPGTQLILDENIREDGIIPGNTKITQFFHNKPISYTLEGIKNYFSHWSYNFLFTDEILPMRYKIPGASILYISFLPLLFAGIFGLLTSSGPLPIVVLGWIILAPLGSSLAFDDVPNVQRTALIFPALGIIFAYGAAYLVNRLKKITPWISISITVLLSIILTYNFLQYTHSYYIHQLFHRPWYRHEGYQNMVSTVRTLLETKSNRYTSAIITNSESAPTIFFLFYGKYDPSEFQSEIKNSTFTSYDRIDFSKYSFTIEECPFREYEVTDKITGIKQIVTTGKPNIVYVNYGTCKEPILTGNVIETIRRSDHTPVFQILTRKE